MLWAAHWSAAPAAAAHYQVRSGAQRGDGAFKLLDRGWVVGGAQNQIELGAEIADRVIIAGELLGRLQVAQRIVDFAERALDAGQHLAVGAALAAFLDAA